VRHASDVGYRLSGSCRLTPLRVGHMLLGDAAAPMVAAARLKAY
jgi:hypothetical protein